MNFTEIVAEVGSRGAEDVVARTESWVNFAYRKIVNAYEWPFTIEEATGTAGAGTVTISDFRRAIVVGDISDGSEAPGRRLKKITYEEIAEDIQAEDITTTGTPEFWWLDGDVIKTFPSGGTVFVRYHKRVAPLSGVQEPIFDEEYHQLIVDRAMVEVYKDTEEFKAASALLSDYFANLVDMAKDYQVYSREHSYIQHPNPYDG